MTEIIKKKRRTHEERAAFYESLAKRAKAQIDIRVKSELVRVAAELLELQKRRPGEPKIGQAASLLTASANAIVIPQ